MVKGMAPFPSTLSLFENFVPFFYSMVIPENSCSPKLKLQQSRSLQEHNCLSNNNIKHNMQIV